MNRKRALLMNLGLGAVLMVGLYFLASNVVPRVLITVSKAGVGTKISYTNSYVLGEKLLAKADGEEKCKVNVFLMDSDGRAVPGKVVLLRGMTGIVDDEEVSDKNGRATFEMVSSVEKQYELKAMAEGIEIPQMVTVTFRD